MHNQTSESRESRITVYHQKIRIIDIPTGRLVEAGKTTVEKSHPRPGTGLHDPFASRPGVYAASGAYTQISAYTHPRPRKSAGTDRTVMLARPLKTERTLTHAPSRGTRTVRRSRRDVTLSLARTSYQCIIPIDHASSRFTLLRSGGLRCARAPPHSAITPHRRPCRTPLAQAWSRGTMVSSGAERLR